MMLHGATADAPRFNLKFFLMLIALMAVSLLIISHACADHSPPPSLDLLSIFRAYKTGVLRVHQDSIENVWVHYYWLFPTKESVERISQLLLKDSVHLASPRHPEKGSDSRGLFASGFANVLCYGLGYYTVKAPRNALVVALRKGVGTVRNLDVDFLSKYLVFKALLYGGLQKEEAELLKSISSEMSLNLSRLFEIRGLINGLTTPRCCADLIAALISSIDVHGVRDALSTLTDKSPDVIDKLVKDYMESDRSNMEIMLHLFSCIPPKSQYELLRTRAVRWRPGLACWRSLYILSRFSESPSEEIQRLCVENNPKYQVYEQAAQQIGGKLLLKMKNFDPRKIPKEIWIRILLCCDNFLFQIYAVPLVCKLWKCLHYILLSHSSTVQEAFIDDWNNATLASEAFSRRQYPWNYFLNSPLTFFTYSLVCLENFLSVIGSQKLIKRVDAHWQQFVQHVGKDEYPMTPASYLGLYVRLCKALGRSLVLYQLPSISDEEYTTLIREFIDMHKIVPLLPKRFLEEDCRRFVRMLERDADLIILLPKSDLQCHSILAICLFLSKHAIPPSVDKVLCQASELYRLLKDVSISTILQNPIDLSATDRLTCGLDIGTLRRDIQKHCFGQHHEHNTRDSKSEFLIKKTLSLAIMMLLCEDCRDYSEEDFCAIQQFLELCGIFDQYSKLYTLKQHVCKLLSDPKVAIELIC